MKKEDIFVAKKSALWVFFRLWTCIQVKLNDLLGVVHEKSKEMHFETVIYLF